MRPDLQDHGNINESRGSTSVSDRYSERSSSQSHGGQSAQQARIAGQQNYPVQHYRQGQINENRSTVGSNSNVTSMHVLTIEDTLAANYIQKEM